MKQRNAKFLKINSDILQTFGNQFFFTHFFIGEIFVKVKFIKAYLKEI